MRILVSVIFIVGALHRIRSEEVRLLNLDPPEAQQYIDKQDTSLKYAPKIESNVPAVRFLGNEPHNVVEDIYLANQYHGQDGLGGYLYGYAVPDIAKTEKKKAGGDLRGAYNYIAGNGQEIKVEYWDDGNGFHQVDNVPKILPKQIDDTPEVKAAKEEHQRIWNEQAERNSRPIENPYDSHFNYANGPLSPQSQAQQLVTQYQQQRQQFPNPGQNVHYQGDQSAQYQGQPSQALNRYQPTGQISGPGSQGSAQFGSQPAGSGQYGGSQPGSGPGGAQFGSRPSGSGQYGASQSSGSQSSGGAASGQFGGSQPSGSGQYGSQSSSGGQSGSSRPGSGQYGAGQPSGAGSQSSGSGQFGGSQPSGSGQYGSQSSSGGQFGSSRPGGGQYGAGQPSGAGSQSSGSGQYGGQSSSGGQFGSSGSGSGQYGAGQPSGAGSQASGSGQYGAGVGGSSAGSGQYGQSASGGQSGAASGQYGAGHSSGGGQFGGSRPSGSGQYGGSLSSGGAGQYGGGGQYGAGQGSSSSGQYGGKYSGSSSQGSGQYSAEGSEGKWNEEEEEKGPPKGFFYNFDYPVGIIVQKDGGSIQKREGDLKDIYTTNKANFEKQLQQGQADRSSRSATGYLVV